MAASASAMVLRVWCVCSPCLPERASPASGSVPVTWAPVTQPTTPQDGVVEFMGFRWESPTSVRMSVRPDLINPAGLLSGAATYALVDYCMGSTLWVETADDESIATLNISINYVATTTEGEVVCSSQVDRRNRSQAVLRSEVHSDDGRLLATAIGSFSIYRRG